MIAEAMRAGLANPPPTLSHGKRTTIVDTWVPTTLAVQLRHLSATHHLPQQHLFRLFLFQYLTSAPWRNVAHHAGEKERRVLAPVKIKRAQGPSEPPRKLPKLTEKDLAEYERTRTLTVNVLDKMGGYEPGIDDYYVDLIARTIIYAKKVENFLDSDTASVDTYASVAYTKLKFAKVIENAIRQLALNRRDRLEKQTQTDLVQELREATQRALGKHGEQ